MEEKNISPEQSLQIIEKMLADARSRFYNNGFAFLFWGVLIILASLADFFLYKTGHNNIANYVWLVAIVFGMIVTAVYFAMIAPRRRSFSKLDSINGKLWIGFGVSYIVLMFLCIHLKASAPPFIYCLLGLAMFASGAIYKFWSMYAGAVIFWIGAVTCTFFTQDVNLLLISVVVMFLGYLVPGYLLWRKAKKEANV